MAISSLINKVYDASGAPSTQAFYGPYQTDDLQTAIDRRNQCAAHRGYAPGGKAERTGRSVR